MPDVVQMHTSKAHTFNLLVRESFNMDNLVLMQLWNSANTVLWHIFLIYVTIIVTSRCIIHTVCHEFKGKNTAHINVVSNYSVA
jgi:hypothetical protein